MVVEEEEAAAKAEDSKLAKGTGSLERQANAVAEVAAAVVAAAAAAAAVHIVLAAAAAVAAAATNAPRLILNGSRLKSMRDNSNAFNQTQNVMPSLQTTTQWNPLVKTLATAR